MKKHLGVFIVDLRISETPQTGAGGKPHLPGLGKYGITELFSEISFMVDFRISETLQTGAGETAPTGPRENIELPNYFLKSHLVCEVRSQSNRLCYNRLSTFNVYRTYAFERSKPCSSAMNRRPDGIGTGGTEA